MLRFEIPTAKDAELISQLAIQTFYESHGTSASEKDLVEYKTLRLNVDLFKKELADPKNTFRLAYLNDVPVAIISEAFLRLNWGTQHVQKQ